METTVRDWLPAAPSRRGRSRTLSPVAAQSPAQNGQPERSKSSGFCLESGAVERNRTSTGKAHSDLNAARLPFPPRPHRNEPNGQGQGEHHATSEAQVRSEDQRLAPRGKA